MRLIDADVLSAFVGDLRNALHKEQSKFKGMTPIEFDTRDYMLLNFQYAIDNAPTVKERPHGEEKIYSDMKLIKDAINDPNKNGFDICRLIKSITDEYDFEDAEDG